MRKLFALGVMLAIAATLIGCKKKNEGRSDSSDNDGGDSREKIVQNFCEAFRSCDANIFFEISLFMKDEIKFADGGMREKNFLVPLIEMAKSKEPLKTKVRYSATVNEVSASIIEVTCDDSSLDVKKLYFFVGYKYKKDGKDKKDKIMRITADERDVERAINEAEELKNKKDKKADADGRDYRKKPSYSAATNTAKAANYDKEDDYKTAAEKAPDDYNVRKFERYVREIARIMSESGEREIGETDIQKAIRGFRDKSSRQQEEDLENAKERLEMLKLQKNSDKKVEEKKPEAYK